VGPARVKPESALAARRRSTLLVVATGLGKNIVLSELARLAATLMAGRGDALP